MTKKKKKRVIANTKIANKWIRQKGEKTNNTLYTEDDVVILQTWIGVRVLSFRNLPLFEAECPGWVLVAMKYI